MAYSTRISTRPSKIRVLAIFLAQGLLTTVHPVIHSSGLLQDHTVPVSQEVSILARPLFAASIQITPGAQGAFAVPGEPHDFRLTLLNDGDMGSDTYDLTAESVWPSSFFGADGITALGDSDGDGTVDSGPIGQGESVDVVVRIVPPGSARVGEWVLILVKVTSSIDPTMQRSAIIQSAIPASFAQVFRDDGDEAESLYLVQPVSQTVIKVTPDLYGGGYPVIAETPFGFLYAWTRTRSTGSFQVSEIEYIFLDRSGTTTHAMRKLVDHSGVTINTYDNNVALAVTRNGKIGMLWYRSLYDAGDYNENIYFAILDSTGQISYGPVNLTNNTGWSPGGTPEAPLFYSPRIAATDDNRFVLVWEKHYSPAPGSPVYDVYYAVRDTLGIEIQGITQFTNDTPGWDNSYEYPAMTSLQGGRVLLAFCGTGLGGEIYYGVINSDGLIVRGPTNLTNDGSTVIDWDYLDAVQLVNGRIVVTWTTRSEDMTRTAIRFAILDSAYNLIGGPSLLSHLSSGNTDRYPSVAAAGSNRAVLTWTDSGWSHLYYALLDSSGNVLTWPMIFRSPGLSRFGTRRIYISYEGHGNATYWPVELYFPLVRHND